MAKKSSSAKAVSPQPQAAAITRGLLTKIPLHLILILLVALAAYANTFNSPFIFDDEASILDNQVIRDLSTFLSGAGYAHNPRRFIGYLSFALNYKLAGFNLAGYHMVNLAIHIINGWLVYALVCLTLRTPFFSNQELGSGERKPGIDSPCTMHHAPFLPLLVALLFVAHPIQTQAVTYIVQRLASLATLFYLGAILLYVWGRLMQERHGRTIHPKVLVFFGLALVTGLAALTTKEIAFTLPFAAILYDFFFFGKGLKKRYILFIVAAVTLVVAGAGILQSDKPLGELISDISRITRDSAMPRLDYLFTQFTVIVTYIRLLFLPVGQNLDYDYPKYVSLFTPQVFFSSLFLLVLFSSALYLYYRSSGGSGTGDQGPEKGESLHPSPVNGFSRLAAFGILWFFLTLSIESSIIPITDVIFEHRLYLPSFGAFLAIAAGLSLLMRKTALSTRVIVAAVLILLLGATTFHRNSIWGNSISLWRDTAAKSPGKARPHTNLGKLLLLAGEVDEALVEAKYAVKLAPENPEALNNLGTVYKKKGLLAEAITEYRLALRYKPGFIAAFGNLGAALEQQGLLDEAIDSYRKALQINSENMVVHSNLGGVLLKKGRIAEAMTELREAIRMEPDAIQPRNNLAVAYERSGDIDKSIAAYNDILKRNPDYAEGYNNLGIAYYRKQDLASAIRNYGEAVRLNPNFTKAYVNLGIAYAVRKELAKALEQFQQAQRVSPGDKEAATLVARTIELIKMRMKYTPS